jgi:hypothetical protein
VENGITVSVIKIRPGEPWNAVAASAPDGYSFDAESFERASIAV